MKAARGSLVAALTILGAAILAALPGLPGAGATSHPLCPVESDKHGGAPGGLCAAVQTAGSDGQPRTLDPLAAWPPDSVVRAPLLLLGEVHDNPAHHRLRSQVMLAIAARAPKEATSRVAVVFEHVRVDQHLALSAFRAVDRQQPRGALALLDALQWQRSGWPEAELFEPLFAAALDLQWPIVPGNVTSADIRAVAQNGMAALASEEAARLGLATSLPSRLQDALLGELEASHCGLLPRSAFGTMADAQRYRDAFMAAALIDAARTHGRAILIAGNGHVRADRGVPWHVARLAPERPSVTVLYLEVDPARPHAHDYVQRDPDGKPVADYVVLTSGVDRPDPCIAMRERFKAAPR